MKKSLFALFAVFVALSLPSLDAEAKRLGGGGSFGMKRDSGVMQRRAAPAPAAPAASAAPTPQAAAPAAPPPSGMSRWLGPLAGLAAGVGLAALLSHFGMGEGFASMLMIGLLVFAGVFLLRFLFARRNAQPAKPAYAGASPSSPTTHYEALTPAAASAATPAASASGAAPGAVIPAGFDVEGFLRQAKLNFIRLQAANDAGNLDDIREFTTPEMFAEIKLQFADRGNAKQETDVAQLNAELLDVSTEAARHLVSVRFYGQIREEARGPLESFDEVWHLTKPVDGASGWVIAGIQQ